MNELAWSLIVLVITVGAAWALLGTPPMWTRPKWLRDIEHREDALEAMKRWTPGG